MNEASEDLAEIQTSLGYTALWVGPPDEEMTTDPATGKPCGVWAGPNGPEFYDLEHVVDPDCDLVREVVKAGKAKFDPDKLGANQRLCTEIVAKTEGQPLTRLVLPVGQYATIDALVQVGGESRHGRRRSRHCRSSRGRALRRAYDRTRSGESEAP
jgi:hypothetical protein